MYFAFPAEPSTSLSTLTSLMATAEGGEGRRERTVKEKEMQRQGEKNKEESNSGDKRSAMGECAREAT